MKRQVLVLLLVGCFVAPSFVAALGSEGQARDSATLGEELPSRADWFSDKIENMWSIWSQPAPGGHGVEAAESEDPDEADSEDYETASRKVKED